MPDTYSFIYAFFVFGKTSSLEACQSYFDLTKQLGGAGGRNPSAKEFGVLGGLPSKNLDKWESPSMN